MQRMLASLIAICNIIDKLQFSVFILHTFKILFSIYEIEITIINSYLQSILLCMYLESTNVKHEFTKLMNIKTNFFFVKAIFYI